MKNLVVTVILVGVLGYFGAKFYLHHEVSSNLDSALEMVRPFADIQYDGISSTMTGDLSIDGISARFGNFKDRVDIDKVSIITPGFFYLLNFGDMGSGMAGSEPEIPESFGFAIEGMRADINDDFMKALSKAAREASPEIDADDTAANCVGKYGFSMGTLKRLGYDDIVMSMSMGYRQEDGKLLVDMWADVEDMYGMQIDLTLDGTMTPQALASGTFRPRMIDGRIEYEDYSLIERTRSLCRRQGLSDEEVIAAELDAFQAAGTENGIAFDEYVMVPYQKFLSGGAKFILTAKPNEPISLSQIDLYKPEDVPALLNLSAEVQ
jgi:hypothetical protein